MDVNSTFKANTVDSTVEKSAEALFLAMIADIEQLEPMDTCTPDSFVPAGELAAMKCQLQQQEDVILELRNKNLDLKDQVTQQYDTIVALRQELNTLTETRRLNVETLLDNSQHLQRTQVSYDYAALEIGKNDTVVLMTDERSSICDAGQVENPDEIESGQCAMGERHEGSLTVASSGDDESFQLVKSPPAPSTPLYKNDNFKQPKGSRRTKQIRSGRIGKSDDKQISFDLKSIRKASRVTPRNSREKESKMHSCPECKKQFRYKSLLILHSVIHTDERPYKCTDCPADFKNRGNLQTHQWIHAPEKPYKCSDCSAAFCQLSNLKAHQRCHSAEKPYKCSDCSAAFCQLGNLKAHQRTHTVQSDIDEKRFMCDICKKSFRQKGGLSRHMGIHSGKPSHQCNVCKKEYRDRSRLSRHLKIH